MQEELIRNYEVKKKKFIASKKK